MYGEANSAILKPMARSARKGEASEININLMPREELGGRYGPTIRWVLTIGRYLIIATEIIALAAFGLSLKLTIDKNNLNKKITSAQDIIDSKAGFEKEFREVQDKLVSIKNIRTKHFNNHLVIEEFNKLFPQGIKLSALKISETELSFSGTFPTAAQLHTLINSFNRSTEEGKFLGLEISELNSPSVKDPEFSFDAVVRINRASFISEENNPKENSESEKEESE